MSSLLSTTYNTRPLREGSFRYIRSDVPDRLAPQDIQWLLEHKVRTVLDLRSPEEAAGRPCPLADHPEFHYRLMTVSTDIAPRRPEDVPESYLSMVTHRAWEVVRAAQQADTNVLYFCNAGKDRTGVISALLLREMGAPRQEIVDNYMLSAENLREMLAAFVAKRPELSLAVVTPRPWYMETFLDRLAAQEKAEGQSAPNTVKLYTRQNDKTLGQLERDGRIINQRNYVRLHFGDMAQHYLDSYDWFTQEAAKRVPKPEDVSASIWCSISPENCLKPIVGTVVYVLEVPQDQVIYFDEGKWDYVLNRIYLPTDEADQLQYREHLKSLGISNGYEFFQGRYQGQFPREEARIRESWKRIFQIDRWTIFNVCGNLWEIRQEWVRQIVRPGEPLEGFPC